MFKYEDLILPHISGKYEINEKEGKLKTKCTLCSSYFCFVEQKEELSLHIDLNTGLYRCVNGCGIKGNLTTFIAEKEGISTKEAYAKINNFYSLNSYAYDIKLPVEFLKTLNLQTGTNCVKCPYYSKDGQEISIQNISNGFKYKWEKGSKANIYGLWKTKDFLNKSYIFLVSRRRNCSYIVVLWCTGSSNPKRYNF